MFAHGSVIRQAFNRKLLLTVCLIALSQFNFGFDQGGFNSTQAMDAFAKRFGDYDPKAKTYIIDPVFLSLFNSLNYITFGFGIIIGSMISSRYGRRMCMFTMSIWALVAAAVTVTSQTRGQILAGRILAYLYIGMELSVVPIFQSEIVPAEVRGLTVASYQISLGLGQLIIGLICRGTSTMDSDAAFRIPFGLFFIVPTIVIACIWFVPESPRWYLLQGRAEESFAALKAFREGSSYTEEQIIAEFNKLQLLLSQEEEKGTFSELFKGPNLRRTMITIGTNFFLQVTGQNFASTYGTLFIKSLGTVNPFTMQNIQAAVGLCIGFLAMWLTDSVGRRPLLFISGGIQALSLFTMAGLGTPANVTFDMKSGIVAAFFLFGVGFSLGWAPISHILSSEIPASRLRDTTYRTASVVNICVQFSVTFSLPYLLYAPYAALGAKVGYIFGSTAVCAIVFTYLCVPECRGRTLEEVDRLFMDGVPIRKFPVGVVAVEGLTKEEEEGHVARVHEMEKV